jgi:hypothetical protein
MTETVYDPQPDDILMYGWYQQGTAMVPYPLSHRDFTADLIWAESFVRGLGLGSGSRALVISANSEANQDWAFMRGIAATGAVQTLADPSVFDARRTEMFLRRLPPQALFGLSGGVMDGMESEGHDVAAIMAKVPLVFARPEAAQRLRQAGLEVRTRYKLGPALAFSNADGSLEYNRSEWKIEERGGTLHLTAIHSRAEPLVRFDTGVAGHVETQGSESRVVVGPGE